MAILPNERHPGPHRRDRTRRSASGRRPVEVDERFLQLLGRRSPAGRRPHGEPSATDLLLVDLPPIAEHFATALDERS